MQRKMYVFHIWNRAHMYGMKEDWKRFGSRAEKGIKNKDY